jgi:hypothetical protein
VANILDSIDRDRLKWAMGLLLDPVTVVSVQEGDQWVVVARQIYVAASGPTLRAAFTAWRRTFVADVFLHVMTEAQLPMACPEDTWAELVGQEGARVNSVALKEVVDIETQRA